MSLTVFKETSYQLSTLVDEISRGEIALPDIQRPFVWKTAKVRDLFDSMYKGFPVGHLLFWATGAEHGARRIASSGIQVAPRLMIVDGQQRLTSLYSVLTGRPIVRDDYSEVRLRIAFRPRVAEFAVTDAAIERNPEFLPDISVLWGEQGRRRAVRDFLQRLETANGSMPEEDAERLEEALDRLYDVQKYRFTTIELDAAIEASQVADIFVRVNSEGVRLSQADFILTLMSVWWEEGRKALETFARGAKIGGTMVTAANPFLQPSPDQLLRVVAGLAFRRGRLSAVYQVLRGRDITTGETSTEIRERQFDMLRTGQEATLDLTNWHEFLKAIRRAGFRSGGMITSDNNVLFSYLFYLIGRTVHRMDHKALREVIARWFFASALTGRYTGNFESQIEVDLRRIEDAVDGDDFGRRLDAMIDARLTSDFWTINLPNALETAASYSPTLFAYHAALVLLRATPLFSNLMIADLLDPGTRAPRSALERHHLFPKAFLAATGRDRVVQRNQIANFAFVEWPDNASIGAQPPSVYFPPLFDALPPAEQERARFWHALPDRWYELEYEVFLAERRGLIAHVIRTAFEQLRRGGGVPDDGSLTGGRVLRPKLPELLATHETGNVEFKSSAFFSYRPEVPERVVIDAIVKTVAGFLNADGGTLVIGVADDGGEVLGVEADLDHKGLDLDRYVNALTGVLERSLGGAAAARVQIVVEHDADASVCLLHAPPSREPVYASVGRGEDVFFVRTNNSTRMLAGPELVAYVRDRWA